MSHRVRPTTTDDATNDDRDDFDPAAAAAVVGGGEHQQQQPQSALLSAVPSNVSSNEAYYDAPDDMYTDADVIDDNMEEMDDEEINVTSSDDADARDSAASHGPPPVVVASTATAAWDDDDDAFVDAASVALPPISPNPRVAKWDLSRQERNHEGALNFLDDPVNSMTWSRRGALYLAARYRWYNPQLHNPHTLDNDHEFSHSQIHQHNNHNNEAGIKLSELPEDDERIGASIQRPPDFHHHHFTTGTSTSDVTTSNPAFRSSPKPVVPGSTHTSSHALIHSQSSDNHNNSQQDDTVFQRSDSTTCVRTQMLLDSYPYSHARREHPSIAKAWAYYEHVALARYVVPDHYIDGTLRADKRTSRSWWYRAYRKLCTKGHAKMSRAEPGEAVLHTALYAPVFTPHRQLGDWGLGIGLYFSTLRGITVLTLLVGLFNYGSFRYYHSQEYSEGQPGVNPLLLGSGICTDTMWVPCVNATVLVGDEEVVRSCETDLPTDRLAYGTNDAGDEVIFALRNNCNAANLLQGLFSLATVFLVVVGILIINRYLKAQEVAFDEDEQTAQDYSAVVNNPPGDAHHPEEWKRFFEDTFQTEVRSLTVAVDNDLLVRCLVERRDILLRLTHMVEPGTSLDTLTLAGLAAKEERARRFWGRFKSWFVSGVPELFARLVVLTAKVQGLAQQDYPAKKIFVMFESEAQQRRVLSAYSIGSKDVKGNRKDSLDNPAHLFRGELVLEVKEPWEPNTIRWQDLNERYVDRLKQQILTTFATFVAIVAIAFLINVCNDADVALSAIAISVTNVAFPEFAKFLTQMEAHGTEGSKQRSLYFKIAIFRWVNTAVVITIITPFTSTLRDGAGLIQRIYGQFFAEISTTTIIQIADPVGHFKRHFVAPRARTQDAMNVAMQGSEVQLAERYTNMTKLLFLCLWYCAIYPGAFFMCSVSLFINYFADRFSLMRSWKRPPNLGEQISEFSRKYFFSTAIAVMAVVSSYYWASFPFDNLCVADGADSDVIAGTWTLTLDTGARLEETVIAGNPIYVYCLQDFLRYPWNELHFPFISKFQREGEEWMTDEQETVSNIYGWSAIGVLALVAFTFFWGFFSNSYQRRYIGTYEARGEDQGIPLSEVGSIGTYVPQVLSPLFSYPLLACSIKNIQKEDIPSVLDWTDPDRTHAFYDLTEDADVLLRGTLDMKKKSVFSQVFYWPPKAKHTNGELWENGKGESEERLAPNSQSVKVL